MALRVKGELLKEFTAEVFEKVGLPSADAETEAEVLVWANLRGTDSHGVLRIPSYVSLVERGVANPTPDIKVVRDTPAMTLLDADGAFGPVVTTQAVERAIAKARQVGIGWVLIRGTMHQGAIGYYSLKVAEQGMVGMISVSHGPCMAPFGAKVRGLHNSPISLAVPAGRHRPLVIDMATSVAAFGKISFARDKGIEIPEGWAIDEEGRPTTDPNQARAVLPVGGPKGSGLAMVLECVSSLMAGNALAAPRLSGSSSSRFGGNSFVTAIDIGTFTDLDSYKAEVDELVDAIKGLPRADGFDEILVPGEPEGRVYDERIQQGIPLPDGTVSNLLETVEKLGISAPDWLRA